MDRGQVPEAVEETLLSHGFLVSKRCDARPRSFDYAARKGDASLLINVSLDIDSVMEEAARDMKVSSRVLGAMALVLGERAGQKELTRGTAYFRYGIPALSLETFEDLLEGQPPLAYAAPGGEYVDIDGARLKETRLKEDMSRGDLASVSGVSRSMVRRYEEGEGNPTVQVFVKIEDALDAALVRPVRLEPKSRGNEPRRRDLDSLERQISNSLAELGLEVVPTIRSPFNAVSTDEEKVVLTGVARKRKGIRHRASNIKDISDVLNSRSVFILREEERDEDQVSEIPLVAVEELDEIEERGGFFDLIEDRCA